MNHIEHIDRAITAIHYALVVYDDDVYLVRALKEMLNLKIDLTMIADARSYQDDLPDEPPPLEGTDGPPEKYRKDKPKYKKLTGRSLTVSQNSAKTKPTAKSVKCPTCGAPPWHLCAKVSTRGQGNAPLGSPQKNDHTERRNRAGEGFRLRQEAEADAS